MPGNDRKQILWLLMQATDRQTETFDCSVVISSTSSSVTITGKQIDFAMRFARRSPGGDTRPIYQPHQQQPAAETGHSSSLPFVSSVIIAHLILFPAISAL